MRTRLSLALLAVAGAALVWWAFGSGRARTALSPATTAAAPRAEPSALAGTPEAETESARALAQRAAAAGATDEPHAIEIEVARAFVRGRVVDAEGRGLEQARVELCWSESDGQEGLDLALRDELEILAVAATDAEGRFTLEADEGRAYRLRASSAGLSPRELRGVLASAESEVEIVLEPAASIRGRVTRAADGAPAFDVRVRAFRRGGGFRLEARTDASGYYHLTDVPPEPCFVEAIPPVGTACSNWAELHPEPGEALERDLVLPAGLFVRGRITDASSGLPIAGAEVGEGWTFRRFVRTDEDGRYEFRGLGEGYGEVAVRAEGYGRTNRTFWRTEHGDILEWNFALEAERRAIGRVVDATGRPSADVYVAAAASEDDGEGQKTDWVAGRTDAEGRFALAGLRPDLRHALLARKRGHGTVVYDFPADELERVEVDLGTIALAVPGALAGVVADEAGRPYPELEVVLDGANADRARLRDGLAIESMSLDFYVAKRETNADARGRFAFVDVAPGAYQVRVTRPGAHETVRRDVEIVAGETTRTEVVIERGRVLAGRVVTPDGEPPPRRVYLSLDPLGSGSSGDVSVEEDGTFEVVGLTGSRYEITAYPYAEEDDERQYVKTRVEDVEGGRADVVVTLREARWSSGVVLDADGSPIEGARVLLCAPSGDAFLAVRTDEAGAFRLRVPLDGLFETLVQPPFRPLQPPPERLVPQGEVRPGARIELTIPWRP